jgi:hypothetical protein
MPTFFGKYRGKIVNLKDPLNQGRVEVSVPSVFGVNKAKWAMPCVFYAGKDRGAVTMPPIDSNVWVEFEAGDPDLPIWSGCFWGAGEFPSAAKVSDLSKVQLFQIPGFKLMIDDSSKKTVTLEVKPPFVDNVMQLVFDKDQITLSNKESNITLKPDAVSLSISGAPDKSTSITLNPSEITLNINPSILKLLRNSGIELEHLPSSLTLTPTGIESKCAGVETKITPSALELVNSAASVKLSPVAVNLNNGALEVV